MVQNIKQNLPLNSQGSRRGRNPLKIGVWTNDAGAKFQQARLLQKSEKKIAKEKRNRQRKEERLMTPIRGAGSNPWIHVGGVTKKN